MPVFFSVVEVVFRFEDSVELRSGDGVAVKRDNETLKPGNSYVRGMFV